MVAHINRNYLLLGFIFSIISGVLWPSMPTLIWLMPIVVLFLILFFTKCCYWGQGILLGCLVVMIHGNHYHHVTKTLFSQGSNITVQAKVISLVHPAIHGKQTMLSIYRIGNRDLPAYLRPKVKAFFQFQGENQPQLGEYWQFNIQVKPIIGQLNDAGFDGEQYYVSNQWHGKAVIDSIEAGHVRIQSSSSWRLWLYNTVSSHMSSLRSKAFILALAFGDRSLISNQQWRQLRDSGLSHLMAISGLHIGLAVAIGWNLGRGIKSLMTMFAPSSGLVRYLPFIISFGLAYFYAYLAGFSLPTQRALIMAGLALFMLATRIHWSVWQVLLYSLALILPIQPFAILQASFWLSYCAIVIIYVSLWFYVSPQQVIKLNWRQVIIVQLGLFIGLAFLSVVFFGGVSWISPLVNIIAIPWVSMIVVPVIFIGLAMTAILNVNVTSSLWQFVDVTLHPIVWLLEETEGAWLPLSSDWGVMCLLFSFAILAWHFRYYSTLYVASLVIVLWDHFPALPKPEWKIQILDVGQGLAVLIRKDQKSVLYDTGISWLGGSVANSLIVPLLNKEGEYQLSGLIISHTDADHAGGRTDIESVMSPKWMRSSEDIHGYQPCIKGQSWRWQGLNFDVIWPPKQVDRAYNPHSCVIKVSDDKFNFLLTGDVDAISEILMLRDLTLPNIDVMTVPHHGSATSSFSSFVETLSPTVAIASASLDNQWGLPNSNVKKRYQANGAQWLETAHSGQITISIYSTYWSVDQKRMSQYQPWYRQIVRNELE